MSKRILLTRNFPPLAAEMLRDAGFEVSTQSSDRPLTQEELYSQAKTHDALLCTLSDKIDAGFIRANSQLKVISQFAVGYDNIALDVASELGIPVGFTPDVLTDATADVAFALMLATSRKMFFLHKGIINGKWTHFKPNANLGIELKNKTLGIFGLGRIGFEMAKRCRGAYNMKVVYHNRKPNRKAEEELDATYVSFNDLLEQSDVLSVHCSLSEATKGIFNKETFEKMKPNAIFINTARGLVHNEGDLIAALKSGTIWGAGLDVTNPEPMSPDNELLHMENVCVLPHIGSGTVETRNEMARLAAQNIISFFENGSMPHIVNPEVLKSN
ncbi:2-hydroxyacid dehydrogenase [Roseimarinus sediminis]|uniref:2-hydroxyacid dehydrogenase n=1 Tax=Roseimarinus sediminis TaxID=1610899 RepID=UPI003D1D5ED5